MDNKIRITLQKSESDKIRKTAQELKVDVDLNYAPYEEFEILVKGNTDLDSLYEHFKQFSIEEGLFLTEKELREKVKEAEKLKLLDYLLDVKITEETVYIEYYNVKNNGIGQLVKNGNKRYVLELKNVGRIVESGTIKGLEYNVGLPNHSELTKLDEFEEIMEILAEEMVLQFLTSVIALGDTGKSVVDIKKKEALKLQPTLNKKKSKNKGKKKAPIYIKYTDIKIDIKSDEEIEEIKESVQRENKRHVSQWNVKGHWRTYKTGKKIWIKAQTRKASVVSSDDSVCESNHKQEYIIRA